MSENLIVNDPNYWKSSVRPRGFAQWAEMYENNGKLTGLWEIIQFNPKTREVVKRVWNKNVVTDQGANYMLQRALNSSGATLPGLFNNLLITNNSASTTLSAAILASQTGLTSISVNALPAALPNGTILVVGFGSGTTLSVTVNNSGGYAQGYSGTVTCVSFNTSSSQGYAIGASVVPQPLVTDNPANTQLTSNATTPLSQYSGNLATGAFTYTPTSGAGNRSALVTYTFANSTNGGTTPNGSYTDAWIVNVSSGATTNDYLAHEINNPMQVNNSNSIQANVTIKI